MSVSSWFSKLAGTSVHLDNLECVLIQQLQDLYSVEDQLVEALPKMIEAANSPELKHAIATHLEETKHQKQRLEMCFRALGKEPKMETCEAMKGLIAEADEVAHLDGDPDVRDAIIIAAAQRVEHYEIAGYGCVRTFARRLGRRDVAELLQETLDEEANADKILTQIAEGAINVHAAHA